MAYTIKKKDYVSMYGPTVGDKIRLKNGLALRLPRVQDAQRDRFVSLQAQVERQVIVFMLKWDGCVVDGNVADGMLRRVPPLGRTLQPPSRPLQRPAAAGGLRE